MDSRGSGTIHEHSQYAGSTEIQSARLPWHCFSDYVHGRQGKRWQDVMIESNSTDATASASREVRTADAS